MDIENVFNLQILRELREGRIFSIYYDRENKCFCLMEECDQDFVYSLSKQDCLDLSAVFQRLAELSELAEVSE